MPPMLLHMVAESRAVSWILCWGGWQTFNQMRSSESFRPSENVWAPDAAADRFDGFIYRHGHFATHARHESVSMIALLFSEEISMIVITLIREVYLKEILVVIVILVF